MKRNASLALRLLVLFSIAAPRTRGRSGATNLPAPGTGFCLRAFRFGMSGTKELLMMRTALALATLAVATFPATIAAQEAEGSITGTLNLDSAVWYVKGQEFEPGSTWRDVDDGRQIRLVGYPVADPESATGAIVIDFLAAGNPSQLVPRDVTIAYLTEDGAEPYAGSGEAIDLEVTAMTVLDDQMALAGSFAGTLLRGGGDTLIVELGDREGTTVDGNFQATIYAR
jgi:hypothetical protein